MFFLPSGAVCLSHHMVDHQTLAAEILPAGCECDSAGCGRFYDEAKRRRRCFKNCSLSEFQSRWFLIDSQSQYLQFVFFTLQFSRVPGVLLLCFRELSLAWEHIEKNMQYAYAWIGSMVAFGGNDQVARTVVSFSS